LFLVGIGWFGANPAVVGCTDQNLAGCGRACLCQQHFVVNDPNGQVVCCAGAANAVHFF
jgi:hypothetical protein